jgi:glucan phosphoethanolaminetransferase (alkaline phosphatase superfamily)
MDESVSGDLLGVNGGPAETTPTLGSRSGVFNYGIASSISNLSSNTNIALQSGLGPDQIPDRELRALKGPSLFSYMQRAGYRVHFIDTQNYSSRPQNLMSRFDLDGMDRVVPVRAELVGVREDQIDLEALRYVREAVEGEDRSFTYVLKTGAHFPYGDKYPADRAAFASQADLESRYPGLEGVPVDYVNAVWWSVDEYLGRLLDTLEETGRDVLVVYTSDHGQSFGPTKGSRQPWPHGVVEDPPLEQAAVPIVVAAVGQPVISWVSEHYDDASFDRTSQFEIFPGLLQAAGYTPSDVPGLFTSLFDPGSAPPERMFLSGNLFGSPTGAYNHPMVGVASHRNAFQLDGLDRLRRLRRAASSDPAGD